MRPDQEAAAAVNAARTVPPGAGHNLDPLTVAAALAAAATAHPDHGAAAPPEVVVTGPVGDGLPACTAMARATHYFFAAAADTYLHWTGAEHYVEQHATGRDGTRYVITFHQPDGRSPDDLFTAAEATLTRLQAAIIHLAGRLEVHAPYSCSASRPPCATSVRACETCCPDARAAAWDPCDEPRS